jgi:hypothetical protein
MDVFLESLGNRENQLLCVSPCTFIRHLKLIVKSRTHLPAGVKTKNWEERMEKTKRDQAIKKLQAELKDEKQSEITRFVCDLDHAKIHLDKC